MLKKQENEWEVKDHNFTNELFYRGETEKIHQLVDLLYSARITDFTDKKYEDNSERDSVSSFSIIYLGWAKKPMFAFLNQPPERLTLLPRSMTQIIAL